MIARTLRTQVADLLRGAAAFCVAAFVAGEARADLKLCNRMSYVVEAAIGIDEKSATATRGWFRIDPAACRVVLQGALTADRILLNARALGVYGASPIPQNGSDIRKRVHIERRCRSALISSCPGIAVCLAQTA